MRVRGFTQDDAHVFCTPEQVQEEVTTCIRMVYDIYSTFGFTDIEVFLSTRPEKRVGTDEMWDKAEAALDEALKAMDIPFVLQEGEGAFYGPKIEFVLSDCLDRKWQCGTVQLDFALPERMGATYIAEDNEKRVPVVIHRAILGSLERFVGILIEEFEGKFPTWLAPLQVAVLNITDGQGDYAKDVAAQLKRARIRALADTRNEKVGFKIREHTLKRTPYMFVVGGREMEEGTVNIRTLEGVNLGTVPVADALQRVSEDIGTRNLARPAPPEKG